MVKLSSSAGELLIAADRGGCVSAFRWHGNDILRPFANGRDAGTPTNYAAFPLFPFSGRIANARFTFLDTEYSLTPNFAPEPHAIHGNGWQSCWDVQEHNSQSALIVYEHNGTDWPWKYRAEQGFTLTESGLRVDLLLTNLSDHPMPGGIGWHPYFPRKHATLEADVTAIWLSGDDMIPSAPSPPAAETDLTKPRKVQDLQLDNAYSAGTGGSRIHWEDRSISVSMTASEVLSHLVVYTPDGEDFFCVEPVSHAPDALNSKEPPSTTGLRVLKPDQSLAASICLTVEF